MEIRGLCFLSHSSQMSVCVPVHTKTDFKVQSGENDIVHVQYSSYGSNSESVSLNTNLFFFQYKCSAVSMEMLYSMLENSHSSFEN